MLHLHDLVKFDTIVLTYTPPKQDAASMSSPRELSCQRLFVRLLVSRAAVKLLPANIWKASGRYLYLTTHCISPRVFCFPLATACSQAYRRRCVSCISWQNCKRSSITLSRALARTSLKCAKKIQHLLMLLWAISTRCLLMRVGFEPTPLTFVSEVVHVV